MSARSSDPQKRTNILRAAATQPCRPPPHEYSSASLTLKRGNTTYCMRLF